jgi:cell shape-determining protein MreD
MEKLIDGIEVYLNVPYLLTFMFLGYLVKRYFQTILNTLFKREVRLVFVVLILATIVAIPYLLFKAEWQKILLTYCVGTSLHELFFTWIENKFKPTV